MAETSQLCQELTTLGDISCTNTPDEFYARINLIAQTLCDLECKSLDWSPEGEAPLLFDHRFGTAGADTAWSTVVSGIPRTTSTVTVTKSDMVALGMPECHNALDLSIRLNYEYDETEGDGNEPVIQAATRALGVQDRVIGSTGDGKDEEGRDEDGKPMEVRVQFNSADQIILTQEIFESSPAGWFEQATVRSVVRLLGSGTLC